MPWVFAGSTLRTTLPQLDSAQVVSLRPRLVRLGYRMLGSVAEAEDAVQDALLRYQRVDAEVDNPEAFLSRTVTRVCLDALKSARRKRETYVGPWLPEPIFDAHAGNPQAPVEAYTNQAGSLGFKSGYLLNSAPGAHTVGWDMTSCNPSAHALAAFKPAP